MNYKLVCSAVLTISVLLSVVSCTNGNKSPSVTSYSTTDTITSIDTTEVTSVTETTEITSDSEDSYTDTIEEIAEFGSFCLYEELTAEESKEEFEHHTEGCTIKKLASSEFESLYESLPKDSKFDMIVIEVTDIPGLYIWIDNYSSGHDQYYIPYVYYNGDLEFNGIDFIYDERHFVVLKSDELVAIGVTGNESEYYIYNSIGRRHLGPDCGRDGSRIELYVVDGTMYYRMENPIITHGKDDPSIILENVLSPYTWKEEWGVIDSDLNFRKEGRSTVMDDGYLSSLLPYDGICSTDELFKKNNAKFEIELSEIDLLPEHNDLPVYIANPDLTVPGFEPVGNNASYHNKIDDYICHLYSSTGFFHDEYIVYIPDYPELAFVFETYIYIDQCNAPTLRSQLQYVYFNGYKFDASSYSSIGEFDFNIVYAEDIIAVIGGAPCGEGAKFLLSENGIYDSSIEKETGFGYQYNISVTEDDTMEIRMIPIPIAHAHHMGWCLELESDDPYSIDVIASVTEDGVVLTETGRITMEEFYQSDKGTSMREYSGASTFEAHKEYLRNTQY